MPSATCRTKFLGYSSLILLTLFFYSCKKGDIGPPGPAGTKSLLDVQPLEAGVTCANGGVTILSGNDKNDNGKLDSTEVAQTQNVCNGSNGAAGLKSLLVIEPLAAGTACANGGVIIRSGIDKNGDEKLDSAEVDQIQNVCNGANGVSGGEQDKQIALPLGGSTSASLTPGLGLDPIIKFKKSNFGAVDSIVFIAVPFVSDPSFESVVDLFNVTDQVGITGSEITSNQLLNVNGFLQTGNLYDQFPDKEITLVTRTRSTREGAYAGCYYAYLVLYRK